MPSFSSSSEQLIAEVQDGRLAATAFLEYPLALDDLAADEALFVVGVLAAPLDANGV